MSQHTIPIDDISRLVIKSTGGNLYLTGWNRDEIRVKDSSEQDSFNKKKDLIEITFPNDGIVHLPHHLPVTIESVGKDAVIKGIGSPIQISSVGGDLILSDVSPSNVKSVGGDMFAKRVQGDLVIENVGQDCLINNVNGQLSLQQVGKDIQIEKVAGGIEVLAGGDGQVNFSPVPWQAYSIKVGGDLSVSLPEDSNAELSIESKQNEITVKLGAIDEKVTDGDFTKQIGEGGPSIMLSAGGSVFVASDNYNWISPLQMNAEQFESIAVDFSAQAAEQIKNNLGHLEIALRESLSGLPESMESAGLSEEKLQQFKIQIEESSRLAIQKAGLAAVKARAKAEKSIAKAQRKAQKIKKKTREFDLDQFFASQAEKKSVSDSERLMILEMLQEKKISPDEADDLLKALEGKKKQ
ncbi:MAG: hypothetical protein WBB64_14590 [Anaerolineales bacterium]